MKTSGPYTCESCTKQVRRSNGFRVVQFLLIKPSGVLEPQDLWVLCANCGGRCEELVEGAVIGGTLQPGGRP